jgi:hypothetical protein
VRKSQFAETHTTAIPMSERCGSLLKNQTSDLHTKVRCLGANTLIPVS